MFIVTTLTLCLQNLLKAASVTQKQMNLVKLHEQSKKNLEEEIQNFKDEAQKQRKIIFQLEKERDRYINEASELTQKVRCKGLWTQLFCFSKLIRKSPSVPDFRVTNLLVGPGGLPEL